MGCKLSSPVPEGTIKPPALRIAVTHHADGRSTAAAGDDGEAVDVSDLIEARVLRLDPESSALPTPSVKRQTVDEIINRWARDLRVRMGSRRPKGVF